MDFTWLVRANPYLENVAATKSVVAKIKKTVNYFHIKVGNNLRLASNCDRKFYVIKEAHCANCRGVYVTQKASFGTLVLEAYRLHNIQQ